MNEKLRNGLVNMGLVVAGIVVFFVISEGYFAVFNPQIRPVEGVIQPIEDGDDNFTKWSDFFQYDEMLGWAHKPNAEGIHVQKGWETQIRINSKGIRDREYEYKKPEGIKRIVVLGDSFTWGWGVEEYERFSEVLENIILENSQVINMGAPGYGNDQELLIFKNEGIKYDPDLVVVAFYVGNDIMDNSIYIREETLINKNISKPLFVLNDDNKLVLTNVPVPRKGEWNDDNVKENETSNMSLAATSSKKNTDNAKENVTLFLSSKKFMGHHSHAYVFIASRIESSPNLLNLFKIIGIVDKRTLPRQAYGFGFDRYSWNLTKAILEEIDAVAKTNNAKTFIVIIPTHEQVYKKVDTKINGALVDFCEESNITVLDLLPEFRKHAENGEKLYFEIDPHWNANGHKLMAELIYDTLVEEQLDPIGGEQ